jgi:FlgD Ig-like domain
MKKILLLIVMLFSSEFLAQTPNWTDVKETNISVVNPYFFSDGVDIFTNRDGNHIIVQELNYLKYYKMNINGQAGPAVNIETFTVSSPSICGDADNIYIVYGVGNILRVRRSIDGGNNWQLLVDLSTSNSLSRMESVVSNHNLHVTYQKFSQIYYDYRNYQTGDWFGEQLVSEGENGDYPRITARYGGANNDYVYFVWQRLATHIVNWRRYEVTSNTWENKKYGYEVLEPNLLSSTPAGFNVTSSTIIFYYYYRVDEPGGEESTTRKFRWTWKDLNNNPLETSAPDENHWYYNKIYSTTTTDNKSHVVYYLNEGATNIYDIWRSNSINGYWQDNVYDYTWPPPFWEYGPRYINNSSAGNEVHVIWKDEYGNNGGNNLRYKYDDQVPLAPQNLTSYLDPDPSCNSCHGSGPGIRLDWVKNNEPDLSYYTIYRSEGTGCNACHGSGISFPPDSTPSDIEPVTVSKECPALQGEITEFSSFRIEVETGCLSGLKSTQKMTFEPIWAWSNNYWVDKNIQEDYTYLYFVTAMDVTSHESGQSDFTSTYVPSGSFNKIFSNFSSEVNPKVYFLYQNFPNPFNPSTNIHYQLPEPAYVTLEIFNCLGQKVRTLVNEFKADGYYSVVWDSTDDYNNSLPSGIYYYRLTTDEFSSTKKLILLK